ncbi:hypothetical protein [Microvirga sp. P5_D2]
MRLPFPDCVFIHELTHHPEVHRPEVTELVTRATEQDDGSIVLLNFGRRRGNSFIYRSLFLLRVETQQEGTGAAEMVTRVRVEEGADCDQAYRDAWSGMISLHVMLSAFMLTSVPPDDEAFTVTTQETSALQVG